MRHTGIVKALPRRPRDANQLGALIVGLATGTQTEPGKSEQRVKSGRSGGLRGGPARREALPEEKRREIAQAAAKIRWQK
jgi:hypothetical protein